jgi:hypothetical protein
MRERKREPSLRDYHEISAAVCLRFALSPAVCCPLRAACALELRTRISR